MKSRIIREVVRYLGKNKEYFFFIITKFKIPEQCNGGASCILLESCTGLYIQLQQGNSVQLTLLLRNLHCGFADRSQPKVL